MSPIKDKKLLPEHGKLYLIPLPLSEDAQEALPIRNHEILSSLRWIIAERVRTARRFIRRVLPEADIDAIRFLEIDKHDPRHSYADFLRQALDGNDIGLMSEAGCPGVADPGARIVAEAHGMGIELRPLIGPSSILLALMASGLNGQEFTFHGYLPRKQGELRHKWTRLVAEAEKGRTQIFIETPYRNRKLLSFIADHSPTDLILCVASDLCGNDQRIERMPAGNWKNRDTAYLHKVPAIFLVGK